MKHGLTLITCTPIGTVENRWIVQAERVGSDEINDRDGSEKDTLDEVALQSIVDRIDFGDEVINARVRAFIEKYSTTNHGRRMLLAALEKMKETYRDDARRQGVIDELIDILER